MVVMVMVAVVMVLGVEQARNFRRLLLMLLLPPLHVAVKSQAHEILQAQVECAQSFREGADSLCSSSSGRSRTQQIQRRIIHAGEITTIHATSWRSTTVLLLHEPLEVERPGGKTIVEGWQVERKATE